MRTSARRYATPLKRFASASFPYGQEIDHDASCSPTYKFTGYEFDSETGNYYAYARYYNPRLGRFMSPDPLGGTIMNPQSLNGYTYVLNNPMSFTDPTGLVCEPDMPGANCGSESQPHGGGFLGIDEFQLLQIPLTYTYYGFGPAQQGPSGIDATGTYSYAIRFWVWGPHTGTLFDNGFDLFGNSLAQSQSYPIGTALRPSPVRPPQSQKPSVPPKVGPSPRPDTPATWDSCKLYRDGTGAGETLYQICKNTPNGPWWNCVRGGLLSQFTPNDNLLDLTTRYLVVDHPYYFGWCAAKVLR